jgi:hypothetical protein
VGSEFHSAQKYAQKGVGTAAEIFLESGTSSKHTTMRAFLKGTLRTLAMLLMMSGITVLGFMLCLDSSAIVTKYLFPLATKYTPLSLNAESFRLSLKGEVATTGFELRSPSAKISLKTASLKIDLLELLRSRLNFLSLENLSLKGAIIEVSTSSESIEREDVPSSSESTQNRIQLNVRNAEIEQSEFSYSSAGLRVVASQVDLSAKKLSYPGSVELSGKATLTVAAPQEKLDFTVHGTFSSFGELERIGLRSTDSSFDFSNFEGNIGSIDLTDRTLGIRVRGSLMPKEINLSSVTLSSSVPQIGTQAGTLNLSGSARYYTATGESSASITSLAINSPFIRSFYRSPLLDALEFVAEIKGKGESKSSKEQHGEVEIVFPTLKLSDGKSYETSTIKAAYHKENLGWRI